MANLCSNYLKRRNRLNDSVCQLLNEDDYGFLPWSQQIFTKAKRQLGTQTNILQYQENRKNISKERKLKTSARDDILDNQDYLSPVNLHDAVTDNSRPPSVSPLYHSIDSPTLVAARAPTEKTQPSSARRCLFDDSFLSDRRTNVLSKPDMMNAERQENMLNNNENLTPPIVLESTQAYQRNNYYEKKQNYLVNFNSIECVDETADHCMSLSDVEDKLHEASVFLPANILMQTTVTHLPKTPNTGELGITKGVIVTGLFKTRNWICVKLPTGISGYVPYECVRPLGVKMSKNFTQQFPEGITLKDELNISTKCNLQNTLPKSVCTPIRHGMLPKPECKNSGHIQSDQSSQEGIYVLADNLYERVYGSGNNYDEIDSDKDSNTEEKDRCLLTETIEKCRHPIVQRDSIRQRKRTPLYLNNNLQLTPALSKLQFLPKDTSQNLNENTIETPSVLSPSISPRTESGNSETTDMSTSSCERDYISLTAKCYICKKSVKSKNCANRKFTCVKCVLAELKHTPDLSKDCGYESARSEHGFNSNRSNLLKSIESLNISEDSGQETYSQDSYNLDSSPAYSEYSDSEEDRGANLTVLFDYDQKDSHDLSIKKQEIVTFLYDKHENWLWVRNRDGIEGYVPKNYVVNLEKLNLDPSTKTTYL